MIISWAIIGEAAWKVAKPLLKKGSKKLRDKWAAELKELDEEKSDHSSGNA